MKKIIDFDPSLRKEIESGKYEVETRSGRKVMIIDWACKCYDRYDIVAKLLSGNGETENIMKYYSDGRLISDSCAGPHQKDLVLAYEEEEENKEKPRVVFSNYRPALESGELSAFTEFGEPVEIVKWDCKGKYPILAVIYDGDTDDSCFYDEYGVSMSGSELTVRKTEEVREDNFPEGFIQTTREYLDSFIEDGYFPPEIVEAAEKIVEAIRKDDIIFKQDPKEDTGVLEVIDLNIPLSDAEVQVKREVLEATKNGKLSHIEVKAMTGNLRNLLKPKEEKKSLWERATESMNVPGDGALVYRRIFGKDKIVITDRVRKGDVYCKLISLGTITKEMTGR